MTDHEKLIEAMARAIEHYALGSLKATYEGRATAALTAIAEQGYAVVPREAGATSMLRMVLAAGTRQEDGNIRIEPTLIAEKYPAMIAAVDICRSE